MMGQFGTPFYMAPELFDDGGHYGPDVDVYAFSMILFDVVIGEVPFKKFSGFFLVWLGMKVANGKRLTIPSKMRKLIERCWNQEAASRPSFAEYNDL